MEKRIEHIKMDYQNVTVPTEALARIQKGIDNAKSENKITVFHPYKRIAIGAAAAFALCLISVNSSATVANAMGQIPVIGRFFEVITVREYSYSNDGTTVTAQVPRVVSDSADTVNDVNKASSEYIDSILARFELEFADYEGGFQSLDISYEVASDTQDFFSLDIIATETSAGGYEFHKYYTIEKSSGKILTLSDVYESSTYIEDITAQIIEQMEADKDTPYYIGREDIGGDDSVGFTSIREDQNFYIDDAGNLVICFDEYEVGPGSIGAPQFVVNRVLTDK